MVMESTRILSRKQLPWGTTPEKLVQSHLSHLLDLFERVIVGRDAGVVHGVEPDDDRVPDATLQENDQQPVARWAEEARSGHEMVGITWAPYCMALGQDYVAFWRLQKGLPDLVDGDDLADLPVPIALGPQHPDLQPADFFFCR